MIAAAALGGHAFRLRPDGHSGGQRGARALAHGRPLCRSRRHGAAGGRLAGGKRPAQGGDPGPARLRRLPQGMGRAGRDLGQGRHHHLLPTTSAASARARRAAAGPARTPWSTTPRRGRAAARPISRRAALSRRREHGRRGGPGRRRSGHRGRRADPESRAALRSRDTFGPVASGGLWFFAHTIPWLPAGPTSIDFKPTDNPKTLEKLQNDPMMLRQARMDMGYGLVDLMDARHARRPSGCTCPT